VAFVGGLEGWQGRVGGLELAGRVQGIQLLKSQVFKIGVVGKLRATELVVGSILGRMAQCAGVDNGLHVHANTSHREGS
jgi:hypothetical protein